MSRSVQASPALVEKYGQDLFAHPPLTTRRRLDEKLSLRDDLDQHFAKISMEFASAVCRRPALDQRSRLLVQIGQFAISRSQGHLRDALEAAIEAKVPLR